jgi:hypothetical protein
MALVTATLTVIPVSTSSANTFVGTGATNTAATQGTKNGSLFVAVERATAAVAHTSSVVATGHADARSSTGLIFKDSSSGTAQTATVAAGTVLSLYAQVSTTTAFSVTGGTLAVSATAAGMTLTADSFTSTMVQALFSAASAAATTATPVAVLWTAPTTAGSYTVTMRTSTAASQAILASGGTSHDLVVTVLASATANHSVVGGTNNVATNGRNNESLYVAIASNSGALAVVGGTANASSAAADIGYSALSKGLLAKDSSNGTAQTATVLAGGVLSLYASVSTASAFSATGGSFSRAYGGTAGNTPYYNSTNTYVGVGTATTSTGVAVLWTAPTTAGTYTVSLLTGFSANGAVSEVQTAENGLVPPTLSGAILVTVVATSAGGTYTASRSTCSVQMDGTARAYSSSTPALDTTDIFENGQPVYLSLDLNDAYSANLPEGNFTVTATGAVVVNMDTAAATLLAGTTATDIFVSNGSEDAVRIDQATAGAPVTSTVTVSYNGTPVCTKTVSIRGAVAKLTVGNIATQALGAASTSGGEQWMYQKTGVYTAGQFTVVATDSAGNVVSTDSALGSYAAASGTGTQIPAVTVNTRSSTANASSPGAYNYGGFACGNDAGQSTVTIRFTSTATGAVITSDPFVARCADTAATYTASLDKASYQQGEIAKATVKFLDSKGNKANNMVAIGANSWVLPYMTAVDSTITTTTGASANSVTDANGEVVYTFTVGTSASAVAVSGTYTGIVSFDAPVLGVKSTPTYKLTVGSGDTSFTEVLKSVVALIASINKQIRALQKLILKR